LDPQCRKRFKIAADSTAPALCTACSAFEEIVEESVAEPKAPTLRHRWNIFRRNEKPQLPTPGKQPAHDVPPETQQSPATFPQCQKCGGPLIGVPMKRHTVIRWFREFVHVTIGLAAFPFVPPYGFAVGMTYILIMLYVEKKRPPKRYWKCQHYGRKPNSPLVL
jgi:hypothetical protein